MATDGIYWDFGEKIFPRILFFHPWLQLFSKYQASSLMLTPHKGFRWLDHHFLCFTPLFLDGETPWHAPQDSPSPTSLP